MNCNKFFLICFSTLAGCSTLHKSNMHGVRQSSSTDDFFRDFVGVRTKGATVSFREVPNFDQLSLEEATHIVYNELIPSCENKGIMLSREGNHNAKRSLRSIEEYEDKKANRSLFDIKRIQKAFSSISTIVQVSTKYQIDSYGLKHIIERDPFQNEYITNGDSIVVMLLKGHKARFGKRDEPIGYNCEFQVKVPKTSFGYKYCYNR